MSLEKRLTRFYTGSGKRVDHLIQQSVHILQNMDHPSIHPNQEEGNSYEHPIVIESASSSSSQVDDIEEQEKQYEEEEEEQEPKPTFCHRVLRVKGIHMVAVCHICGTMNNVACYETCPTHDDCVCVHYCPEHVPLSQPCCLLHD